MRKIGYTSSLAISLIAAMVVGQAPSDSAGVAADSAKVHAPRGPVHVTLQPYFASNSGYSKYRMDEFDYIDGERYGVSSELEFPLDVTLAGANVAVELPDGKWMLEGGIWFNLKDPSKKMKDSDWITYGSYQNLLFSYTESDVTMSAYQFQLGLGYTAYRNTNIKLLARGGFRYQHISQDVNGYAGWQLDTNLQRIPVSGSEKAIVYKVEYNACYAGLRLELTPFTHCRVDLAGAGCYFWVSDFDDHLLRGKTGEANGTGTGGIGSFGLYYYFGRVDAGTRPFVGVDGELTYLSASTRQTQHWYREEGEIPAGYTIPGVNHKITTRQTRIGASLGMRF